jgi:hypothetical protein
MIAEGTVGATTCSISKPIRILTEYQHLSIKLITKPIEGKKLILLV